MRFLHSLIFLLLSLSATAQTINVFGDSYVRNHRAPYQETWHYLAAQRLGWTYRNYGRNGSAVAFDRTKDGFGPAMKNRLGEMNEQADVVMVIAGHNDACLIEEGRGVLADYERELRTLLDSLQARFPAARLCCVTPWHVDRPCFLPVVEVLRRECKERNIPLLDFYADSVIDVENRDFRARYFQPSKNLTDRAHLNADGHRLLVERGARFLARVSGRRDVLDRSVWRRDSVAVPASGVPYEAEQSEYLKAFGSGHSFVLSTGGNGTGMREYYLNGDTAIVEDHIVSPICFRDDGSMELTWVNGYGYKVVELWRRCAPERMARLIYDNFKQRLLDPMMNTEWTGTPE